MADGSQGLSPVLVVGFEPDGPLAGVFAGVLVRHERGVGYVFQDFPGLDRHCLYPCLDADGRALHYFDGAS